MNPEAKIIIAFLFKHSGKTLLKKSDIYLPLSLELGWFSSTQAKEFVKQALHDALLVEKEKGSVAPSFDIEMVTIPTGFRPSQHLYEQRSITEQTRIKKEKDEPLIEQIITTIVDEASGQNRDTIKIRITSLEKEKNITAEVAALIIAQESGCTIVQFLPQVEKTLFTENRE